MPIISSPPALYAALRASTLMLSAALASTSLTLGGCSDEGVAADKVESTSFTCESAFGATCGSACSVELPCPNGLYCSQEGSCRADCSQRNHCGAGTICGGDGSCKPEGDPGEITIEDPVASGDGDGDQSDACIEAKVEFNPVIPQVWLLLDRSGSMDEPLSGSERRWDAIGTVLVGDPSDANDVGIVGEFENLVAFGATFFSRESIDNCSALLLEETPITLAGYNAINSLYESLEPGTGTPTAEAYADLATRVAAAPATSGPKIIIAATDGAPSKCGIGDAQADVETAVSAAYAEGITTFVINVGTNDSDESHLQRVANLGQGLMAADPDSAEFYSAANQDSLKQAFQAIIGSAASCVFQLNGNVAPTNAAQGTVELLGLPLAHDSPDGWRLRSETELEVVGTACQTIQAGISESDLSIRFPCGVFVVK